MIAMTSAEVMFAYRRAIYRGNQLPLYTPSALRGGSLPQTREVAKPKVLTEGETKNSAAGHPAALFYYSDKSSTISFSP